MIMLFVVVNRILIFVSRSNKMKARSEQFAKLNCIYQVLCCLHNLKLKDLKSQVGLFE